MKVYDDVDVFMRDIDKYQVATLLFYEIFKDNKKFLTLNVTKFIRAINNTAGSSFATSEESNLPEIA